MESLHNPPSPSSFTPLSTHQSQTPSSFFSGPPVLHHHSPSSILKTHSRDLLSAPALASLAQAAGYHADGAQGVNGNGNGTASEDAEGDVGREIEIADVDVWVTSERLILFSPTLSTGLSIPYPTITLHAIQSQPPSLFLQLLPSAQTFDDHDPDATISLTIIPSPTSNNHAPPPLSEATETSAPTSSTPSNPTETLYAALSTCANLHPDPQSGSEPSSPSHHTTHNPGIRFSDGTGDNDISTIYPLPTTTTNGTNGETTESALPPPMPGSGGWITADNVGDFFDEEGNWRGGEEWTGDEVLGMPGGGDGGRDEVQGGGLGEGAGSVRREREEEEEGDETKWRRTG